VKTKIIKVDPFNPEDHLIKEAAEYIKKGEVVAFPTETVYGLGADATNSLAVKKIFLAKGRPLDNPIIVHISKHEDIENVAYDIPEIIYKLAKKFWPGPLTVILKRRKIIVDEVSAGLPTVAVRLPSHPVALKLIDLSEKPIAAPSANKAGRPSPTCAEHVLNDLEGSIPLIIDGGKTLFGVESTVIDFTKKPPLLLRPGALPIEEVLKEVSEIMVNEIAKGLKKFTEEDIVVSPGLKYRHYAPQKPLILVEGEENKKIQKINELLELEKRKGKRVGLLITEENFELFKGKCEVIIKLGSKNNYFQIAYNLFDNLRLVDKSNADIFIVEGIIDKGLGLTIMNRLRKASSERIEL
jgi:L-threonylcarbamoyladenylate synthase